MGLWGSRQSGLAILAVTLMGGTQTACSNAAARSGQSVPASETTDLPRWVDVHGAPKQPLATDGRRATVLLFIATDCPISNAYTPEVNRIVEAYGPRGVAF